MVPQRKGNSVEAGDLYITWCLYRVNATCHVDTSHLLEPNSDKLYMVYIFLAFSLSLFLWAPIYM